MYQYYNANIKTNMGPVSDETVGMFYDLFLNTKQNKHLRLLTRHIQTLLNLIIAKSQPILLSSIALARGSIAT